MKIFLKFSSEKYNKKKLTRKRYFSTVFIFIVHICSSKPPANESMLQFNNRNIKKCAKYVQS